MKNSILLSAVLFAILATPCVANTVTSSGHIAYGDSLTAGEGATVTSNGYAALLAADENAALTNNGTAGYMACDVVEQVMTQNGGSTKNAIQTIMIGTNEAIHKGNGTYENIFKGCHKAALAWMAIPSDFKVFGQNSACTKTGTWAADNTYLNGLGEKSSTNGSNISCAIKSYGGPIYAWYRQTDGDGGMFNYSLDGGLTTGLTTATSPAIATVLGGTHGVGLIRITGAGAGNHTFSLTVTSSTSASNNVLFLSVGTPAPYNYWGAPTVYVAGAPKQQNDGDATDTAAYNADALADAALLAGDGLLVSSVNIRNYLNDTSDMYDFAHPNNTGHGHLRDAFAGAEQYVPYNNAGDVLSSSVASGAVNLANSTTTNITSKSITPGQWLIYGTCDIYGVGNSTLDECGVTSTSATMPSTAGGFMVQTANAGCSGCRQVLNVGPINATVTSVTTYYLVGLCNFSSSTCVGGGILSAVRIK